MNRLFYLTIVGTVITILLACQKEVLIEPKLITSTDTLYFNESEIKELVISTKPASTAEYQITAYPKWLKPSLTTGTIINNLEKIRISSDFAGYAPGVYEGKIELMSTSGKKTVIVKGFVGEQLRYTLPDSLEYTPFGNSKGVILKNEGNIALNYTITVSNKLISTASATGSVLVGQQSNIVFLANRAELASGKYKSQIFLKINNKLDTINVSIENFKEQKLLLTTDVVDAEYSKIKDILVYVSSSPSKVNIYDASSGATSSLDLVYTPSCVSISTDGNTAVVGHDGHITYVDLSNKKIIKSYNVSCHAIDIVIGNNKWAYIFPKADQWEQVRCINLNLANENEILHTGNLIYAGTKGKMHPSGKFIYGTNNGLSPSDIEKYNIQNGGATYAYDSRYHGDYPISGDLWFSEDGIRVFTRGKTVLRTSEIRELDMIYNGTISLESNSARIMWLDHSLASNNLYLLSSADDNWSNSKKPFVYVYSANNLVYKTKYELEKYLVSDNKGEGKFYEAEPYFVFSNSKGNNIMVLTKAKGAGLLNEWAIQKFDIE